jgi:transposase, IS30 family
MSHLSYEQRYSIEVLLKAGKSQAEIGTIISVDKSVVSREIKRNRDERNGTYKAKLAQTKYDARQNSKPKHIKINAEFCFEINSLIEQDYSPEQVAGVIKKKGEATVSHEWIYQHIWKNKRQKGTLYTHLRRKGRRYRKRGSSKDSRGQIVGRVGIEKRPKEADNRSEFGHLEVDTIIGQNHKGAIITLNDRASGMLWMGKVDTRDAETVKIKLSQMLDEIRPFIKSITGDNGKEFSEHQFITDEYCDFYFANPYSPWERGSNENLNGLVRQYIPKSSDFSNYSENRILEIQNKLNQRPRKRFNFENPIFVMEKLLFNPKVAFVA